MGGNHAIRLNIAFRFATDVKGCRLNRSACWLSPQRLQLTGLARRPFRAVLMTSQPVRRAAIRGVIGSMRKGGAVVAEIGIGFIVALSGRVWILRRGR